MKHIVFLEADGPVPALHERQLERWARGTPPGCDALTVNAVLPGDAPAPWDAVVELWTSSATLAPALLDELRAGSARWAAYRVTEMVEKEVGTSPGWPTPGIKMIVPWFGRPDVTRAEQRRHWDEHVPLANRIHVGVSRYVRNWVEARLPSDAPDYGGIAMQSFPTLADLQERLFDAPASVQVILDDVAEFIADHVALTVAEYGCTART